jgi:hypothetical protein
MTAKTPRVEDEPVSEERIERAIKDAPATPPTPHRPRRDLKNRCAAT